jgi:signal transduction histidine kinase
VLDVAVNHHGRTVGLLRFEQAGKPRRWTVEEQEYGCAVADRVALSLSAHERRLAEEEIRRLNVGLEDRVQRRTAQYLEALEEQEQFAYSVSHDLRAPLRAMHGFSQALLQDHAVQLDAMGREFARRIMEAAGRMESLIKDLLDYSRLTRSEIPLAVVPLERAIGQALKDLAVDLQERKASVEVVRPLGDVKAHEVTLMQVLTNLVSNAIKFVPRGVAPRAVIRSETRGSRLRLWVEDNGIGIEPAYHERIFRVFERLNRSEDYPGTGIGLAIVRKAILRMGGAAGVVSDGRDGSRFWIELDRP